MINNKRGKRKKIVGIVISKKMQKTAVIEVMRLVKHPKYGKYVKRCTIFKTHDENNQAGVGDKVEIMETRPISKTKNTKLVRIIEKAKQ